MNKRYWKNKRVLITGFEGFLGSCLTKYLVDAGASVVGLDIRVHRKKTILEKADYARMTVVKGSVANYKLMTKVLADNRIQYIFHLAAEALVQECLHNPLKAFESNTKGTWVVLEACRQFSKIKSIVVASTDKAYGSHTVLPYTEEAELKADAPYDVSKSCADLISHAYMKSYHLPIAVTRCGNIYGPGDCNFSRIIPDAIRCVVQNKTLDIRSDGKFVRDYVYVKDIALAYMILAERVAKDKTLWGEAFNFSDEKPLSVLCLLKHIYKKMNVKGAYRILNQAPTEIKKQFLSSQKARHVLGWKPQYGLDKALNETIEWYSNVCKK